VNFKIRISLTAVFFTLAAAGSGWSQGSPVIWDGPAFTFVHPVDVGTSVQDQLTPNVWLTRDTVQGLFNAALETAYTKQISPQDTAWAYGLLADYASLSYTDWQDWNGKMPPSMIGQPAVVHLLTDNIYLSLTFTSWGGSGGAYSYVRSTPSPVPEPSPPALAALSGLAGWLVIRRRKNACAA